MEKDFIEYICQEGGELYVVGGSIRNIVYNKLYGSSFAIKDIDLLCRKIDSDKLIKCLKIYGIVKEVGQKFGVIKFTQISTTNPQLHQIDIALPRTEKSIGPGYKDFKIVSDHDLPIEEDFKRRDATINAMAIRIHNIKDMLNNNIELTNIIDPFGGIQDLKNKIWRAVGDPNKRFAEDPTRIMRAIRQCAELDLELEEKTRESICMDYSYLKEIMSESIVRITDELVRTLLGNFHKIIMFLFSSGITKLIEIPLEGLDLIIKCTKQNSNLRIRIACLLSANNNENATEWVRKFELSAAPHFPKNDVIFIKCVNRFYNIITNISHEKIYSKKIIMIRKLIQDTERLCPNRGIEYINDLIRYYGIVTSNNTEHLLSIYENNRGVILSPSQLKLDGNTIMNLYKLQGIEIKNLKTKLFNLVTEDIVKNNRDDLIQFTNENINLIKG